MRYQEPEDFKGKVSRHGIGAGVALVGALLILAAVIYAVLS